MSIPSHHSRSFGSNIRKHRPWLPDLAARMADRESEGPSRRLPETAVLLEQLHAATCAEDLETIGSPAPERAAAYCAVPDTTQPFLKLRIIAADAALLAFADKLAPGFEVLEVFRAGFQYHWRRDLVRTCDEERPQLGQLCGQGQTRELAMDHITVPVLRKGRIREVRGWLVFSEDLFAREGPVPLGDLTMFRRAERARVLHLPPNVMRPRAEAARLQEMLGRLRTGWGDRRSRDRTSR
jgi:hypothetical protein